MNVQRTPIILARGRRSISAGLTVGERQELEDSIVETLSTDITTNTDAIALNTQAIEGSVLSTRSFNPSLTDLFIIGHRGGQQHGVENSLLTISQAVTSCGFDGVEVDVQMSSDNVPYLWHDNDVDRITTNGVNNVSISSMTSSQIDALRFTNYVGTPYRNTKPTRLSEYLEYAKQANIWTFLEIKNSTQANINSYSDAVNNAGMIDKVVFTSFSYTQLQWIKERYPKAEVGWHNSGVVTSAAIASYKALDAIVMSVSTLAQVTAVKNEKLRFIGITADDEAEFQSHLDAGIVHTYADGALK